MYEYIEGEVIRIKEEYIVLLNNNIGYKIFITSRALSIIDLHGEYGFYISFQMREDGIYLYGFLEEAELDFFELLIGVSGVGPKSGLSMLSVLSVNQVRKAIFGNDVASLTRAHGIGKKTAGRIILELHDKVGEVGLEQTEEDPTAVLTSGNAQVAMEALLNLGFLRRDVEKALIGSDPDHMELEDLIKYCLNKLS